MTSFTLSQNTQDLINLALQGGGNPGSNNINYYNAYTAIYSQLVGHVDAINPGTLNWFQEAGNVNIHQFAPSGASTFIWEYTKAAAESEEGATLTNTDMQNASNAIALNVFNRLANNSFVFSDADIPSGFAPKQIVSLDAGGGINNLQTVDPDFDFAIWGGTLFATTRLNDPTYFSDNQIELLPGTRHADAIWSGLFGAAKAVVEADFEETITTTGFSNVGDLDFEALGATLSTEQKIFAAWTFAVAGPELTALGALAAGAVYIYNKTTGGMITLSSNDEEPGAVHWYDPENRVWLTFMEGDAGEGKLALFDSGFTLDVGGTSDLQLVSIRAGDSDSAVHALAAFLSNVSDPTTATELAEAYRDYLYPEATPYVVTGSVNQTSSSSADYDFEVSDPAAIVTGEDLVTIQTGVDGQGNPVFGQVAPTNILHLHQTDLSQAEITDVQVLDVAVYGSMTADQFSQFDLITGGVGGNGFSIYASSGGTFDASANVDPTAELTQLVATDWSGTTLIGNDVDGQVLQASQLGNDTLYAGDGEGATMIAGLGQNTLVGAAGGGNVFVASNGLAAGSVLDGNGSGNQLEVAGDITGASISGIQTLEMTNDLTLTAAQFNSFSAIEGGGILYAATSGTYDWSASDADISSAYARSTQGTTLVANDANIGVTLYASRSGDDTLIATAGTHARTLDARNSAGAVTMTVGDADDNIIYAGLGANTIALGEGDGNKVVADHGLAAGSSVEFGNASDSTLVAEGNISEATITGAHTLATSDEVTLGATQLAGFTEVASSLSPLFAITLNAASAGTYDLSGKTVSAGLVTLNGSSGADTLTGTANADVINGLGGDDTLNGGAGHDNIFGGEGNDTINGGDDSDLIEGGDGDDTLTGGNGIDGLLYESASSAVTVDLSITTAQNTGGAGTDTISGFEVVYGSAFNDTLSGNSGSNVIDGLEGNDTISGGGGADTLYGSAGNDTIGGGGADDTIDGGDGDDILNGNADADTVHGGEGNDTINGNDGNDTLYGDAGNDTIRGGNGVDTINGGDGDDIIQIFSGEVPSGESTDGGNGTDRLAVGNNNMNPSSMTVANMEELYLNSGVTALTLSAAQLADFETITHQSGSGQAFTLTAAAAGTYSLAGKTITGIATLNGSSGADTLTGSSGNDTVNGNAGNDTIEGGAGNDTLNGGGDTDTLSYANAGSAITIDLSSGSAQSTGGAGTDTISNFENLTGSAYNDTLTGSSSANVILGGDGNDTITAAGGNDTLDGGLGTDSLIGGTGNDTYKLERTYGASEITENDSTGGNTDVLQLGADVARDQLWFTQSGNDLLVKVIGTGAQMTINDWYLGSDYQVEQIKTASNDTLSNSNVQNLVNAMSSLTLPETTTLPTEYHTALDSTIAANWA